jgi:hypothetical protein
MACRSQRLVVNHQSTDQSVIHSSYELLRVGPYLIRVAWVALRSGTTPGDRHISSRTFLYDVHGLEPRPSVSECGSPSGPSKTGGIYLSVALFCIKTRSH